MKYTAIFLLWICILVNPVFSAEMHWTDQFSEYDGGQPPKKLDHELKIMFTTPIPDVNIKAKSAEDAIEPIREALKTIYTRYGMSFQLSHTDDPAFKKPILIKIKNCTLGHLLDLLCEQTGLVWSIENILVLRPKTPNQALQPTPSGPD